jgi:uncharacterized cupredoxin-like copper-binding protein
MTPTKTRPSASAGIAAAALFGLLVAACSGAAAQTTNSSASKAPTAAVVVPATAAASPLTSAGAAPTPIAGATHDPAAHAASPTASEVAVASATQAPAATPTAAPVVTLAPTSQPQSGPVAVTLNDVAIKLDRSSAPSGSVTFAIKNTGTVIHQLVVLKTDVPQNLIPVDPSKPGLVTQPGFITQTQIINPGGTATLTLTLGAGKYVLMCNQAAHYLIGMHTGFSIN